MSDNNAKNRMLSQLGTMTATALALPFANTLFIVITMIYSFFGSQKKNVFSELSFWMWLIITICCWVVVYLNFKKVDMKLTFKK